MNHQTPVLLKPFVALTYILLLAPLAIVVAVSFGASPNFEFPPTQLSLRWYWAFFGNPEFVRAFFNVSLVLGFLAAVLASALGVIAAIGLVRFRFKGREALEAFFVAPLFIPEILFGAALYLTYARLGIKPSMTSLLLGHVVICTPFVIRNVTAGLVGLDPRLEEAAMSLGASRVQAFIKVALPLIQSSIISGFIFAFIISFSDINLALFIAGPNSTTLPVYIFNLLLFEGNPSVAAASTMQILIVGLLIWLVQCLFRPRALA
jgi:ABC-type spermidine/putrescine transport system permease subunit II